MNRRKKAIVHKQRWKSYALASAAVLAVAPGVSHADIHLIEPEIELRDPNPGDGYFGMPYVYQFAPGVSLSFLHAYSETQTGEGVLAAMNALSAGVPNSFSMNLAANNYGGSYYARNLQFGNNISSQSMLSAGIRADMAWASGYQGSEFVDADGYLAFSFDVGNGTQYGWAELILVAGSPQNIFRLERLAFADPGQSLTVGETGIPEPGSLGLLAVGAAGLLSWRRNRS